MRKRAGIVASVFAALALVAVVFVTAAPGDGEEAVGSITTVDHCPDECERKAARYAAALVEDAYTDYAWLLLDAAWWRANGELTAALRAAEAERAAALAASTSSSGSGSSYSGPSGTVSGDCYGSALPSYIIDRESGGNPNAYNPSGAWGCFQIMPGTWGGTCSDLGAHGSASVGAQTECANRLWNGGAGSSHWAATAG